MYVSTLLTSLCMANVRASVIQLFCICESYQMPLELYLFNNVQLYGKNIFLFLLKSYLTYVCLQYEHTLV